MSLMNALGKMLGAGKDYCPDCGAELKSTGCCSDCGYGEDDDMGESEDEKAEVQALLDLRDSLQNSLKMVDRLIVDCCGSESPESAPAAPQQIVWVRQHSK